MATKEDYRNDLKDKLVGLEDSGYGDFEYTDGELDTYLELTVARLFPSIYKRSSADGLALVGYGNEDWAYVDIASQSVPDDRVYLIEDATELEPIREWRTRPGKIVQIDDGFTTVNVYYYEAYTLPASGDAGIPVEYSPLITVGAFIEALEARHDTGVRPDPTNGYQQNSLIDRVTNRWNELKADLSMSLPVVVV